MPPAGNSPRTRATRVAIAAAATLPTLALGAVLPESQPFLAGGIAAAFLVFAIDSWILGRKVHVDGFTVLVLATAAVTLAQAIPVGSAVAEALGGASARHASLILQVVGGTGGWRSLSGDPPATVGEGARLLLCLLVMVASASLGRRTSFARLLLTTVGILGLAEAALGTVSALTQARSLLGLYQSDATERGGFLTTLVNPNNAAGLLNLAAFSFVALALDDRLRAWKRLHIAGAVLAAAGSIATLSRAGGAILLALGLCLPPAIALVRSRKAGGTRHGWPLRALQVAFVALLAVVVVTGFEELMVQLGQGSLVPEHWQTKGGAWGPVLALVADHPWLGAGRGAFATAFAAYNDFAPYVTFDFAENGALQALADWGIPLGTAALLAVAFLLGRLVFRASARPADLAASFGILAVVLQNLVDFSLEVPGVALPTAAVLGLLARRTDPASGRTEGGHGRNRSLLLAFTLLAITTVPFAAWSGYNDRMEAHERLANAVASAEAGTLAPGEGEAVLAREVALHPVDAHLPLLGARLALAEGRADRVQALLEASLVLFPGSLQATLALAALDHAAGHDREAVERFRHALESHPRHANDVEKAVEAAGLSAADVLDVFEARPALLDAYLEHLRILRRHDERIRLLSAMRERSPDDPDVLERLGLADLDAHRDDEAEDVATRLLTDHPDRWAGWYLQGRLEWAANRYLEALAMFEEAAMRPGDPAEASLWAARCLLVLGRIDAMRDRLDALGPLVAKDRYRNAMTHVLWSLLAEKLGETSRALEELERADRTWPDMPDVVLRKALLYQKGGRRDAAIHEYERLQRLEPGNPRAARELESLRGPGPLPATIP